MYVYFLIFLIICIVVLFLQKKNVRESTLQKTAGKETFTTRGMTMDTVLDNYCRTTTGKGNYVGPWNNVETSKCVDSSESQEVACITSNVCYKLIKDPEVRRTDVFKYVSTHVPDVFSGGNCVSGETPLGFNCSLTPQQCSNGIIKGWFFENGFWQSHNCKYVYNNLGQCDLRDIDNDYEVVRIVSMDDPTITVHGKQNVYNYLYDREGAQCVIKEWDAEQNIIKDDVGNTYNIGKIGLDSTNPISETENLYEGANYLKCSDGDPVFYSHVSDNGNECGFLSQCDECTSFKSTCYQFNETERQYRTKNFYQTLYDRNPNDANTNKDCVNFLVNNMGDSNFNNRDFSTYNNLDLLKIFNHGTGADIQYHDRLGFENCVNSLPNVCSSDAVNDYTCKEYNLKSNLFVDKVYKRIYDKEGINCEWCPIDAARQCQGNVEDYNKSISCPPRRCPLGREIVYANGVEVSCRKCGSNEFYNETTSNCENLTRCPPGSRVDNLNLVPGFKLGEEKHTDLQQTTYLHNYQSVSNVALLRDIRCERCGINEYLDYENFASNCKQCEEGTYSLAGAIGCSNCLNGYFRSNGMTDCLMCPSGHVSKRINGKSYCENCISKYMIPDPDRLNCMSCSMGETTFDLKTATCRKLCDSSNYWNSDSNQCLPIPGGKYKRFKWYVDPNGAPNFNVEIDELSNCPSGTFRKEGDSGDGVLSCKVCQGGSSQSGASECLTCGFNEYWNTTTQACTTCDDPNEALNFNKTGCEACEYTDGSFTTNKVPNVNSTECVCKDGFHMHSASKLCLTCFSNQYWEPASNMCLSCPDGKMGLNRRGKNCSSCPKGTYRNGTMRECEVCPIGSFSGLGKSNCTVCSPHAYWNSNNEVCQSCPEGYVRSDDVNNGMGEESCKPCDLHTYRSSDMSNCEECMLMLGKYTTDIGQTECKWCGNGSYYDGDQCVKNDCTATSKYVLNGSFWSCHDCHVAEGKIVMRGDGINFVDQCVSCQDNAHSTASNTCECDEGYRMNKNNECVRCDDLRGGKYWSEIEDECMTCPGAFYTTGAQCLECGEFAEVDQNNRSKCKCTSLAVQNRKYLMQDNSCSNCDNVSGYTYHAESLSCRPCPNPDVEFVNSYGECQLCPENSSPNSKNRRECVCASGFVKNGSGECSECGGNFQYWDDNTNACKYCTDAGSFAKNNSCVTCGSNARIATLPNSRPVCEVVYAPNTNPEFYHMNSDELSFAYCDQKQGFYWNDRFNMCVSCGEREFVSSNACYLCDDFERPNPIDREECICMEGYYRSNGKCVNPGQDTCDSDEYYQIIESFTSGAPSMGKLIEPFESAIQCKQCPIGRVKNTAGDGCMCDNASGYFLSKDGGCIRCGPDQIYDSKTQKCLKCLDGSYPNIGQTECVCPNIGAVASNVAHSNIVKCVCDTVSKYYGDDPNNCQKCVGMSTFWDDRYKMCLTCDSSTSSLKMANENACVCYSRKNINGDPNKFAQEIVDDPMNVVNGTANGKVVCKCNEQAGYYGNFGQNIDECKKCTGDITGGSCVVCGNNAELGPNGTCQCKPGMSQYTVIDNNNNCVCDTSRKYFGKPQNCTLCAENNQRWISDTNDYVNGGKCVTCGNGTTWNSALRRCDCVDTSKTVKLEYNEGPVSYQECVCNSNMGMYGNPNSCQPCYSNMDGFRYWKPNPNDFISGGMCVTCGQGSHFDVTNKECVCNQRSTEVRRDEPSVHNNFTTKCICNNSSHFGNTVCEKCNGYDEIWKLDPQSTEGGKCVKCVNNAYKLNINECKCGMNTSVAKLNNEGTACVCDNTKGYYGNPMSNCTYCARNNQYWDSYMGQCITCGLGTTKSANNDACICKNTTINNADQAILMHDMEQGITSCYCNSNNKYYGDINTASCTLCDGGNRYWATELNPAQCVRCGPGTVMRNGRCECLNMRGGKRELVYSMDYQGYEATCTCDNNAGYFGDISTGCTFCKGADKTWVVNDDNQGGRCVTCNSNAGAEPIGPTGGCRCTNAIHTRGGFVDYNKTLFECDCDITRNYFGEAINNCIVCDTGTQKRYWNPIPTNQNVNGGECVQCTGAAMAVNGSCSCFNYPNTVYDPKTGCVCNSNEQWYGDIEGGIHSQCTKCSRMNQSYWDGLNCITCGRNSRLEANKCVCEADRVLVGGTTKTCECDESRGYFNNGNDTCVYCPIHADPRKVWIPKMGAVLGKCKTCGSNSVRNADMTDCECDNPYTDPYKFKEVSSSANVHNCVCNDTKSYYRNSLDIYSDCTKCDPRYNNVLNKRFWDQDNFSCVLCGEGASVNSSKDGCICSSYINTVYDLNKSRCVCDTSNNYYGDDISTCQFCSGFNKYWETDETVRYGGRCVTCAGGASLDPNSKNACQCKEGADLISESFNRKVCVCNGTTHFGNDSANCVKCTEENHYWDNSSKTCMFCNTDEGAIFTIHPDGSKSCECPSDGYVESKDMRSKVMTCECNENYHRNSRNKCIYCNEYDVEKDNYFDGDKCVTCDAGTQIAFENGVPYCKCKSDKGNVETVYDNRNSSVVKKVCACPDSQDTFANDAGVCVQCLSAEGKYFHPESGKCVRCGHGATFDTNYKKCKCKNNALPNNLVFDDPTNEWIYTCDCDNKNYFGNTSLNQSCEECRDDDQFEKYWNDKLNPSKCVRCGEASTKNVQGVCSCMEGAVNKTGPEYNNLRAPGLNMTTYTHDCVCPSNMVPFQNKCVCNNTTHFEKNNVCVPCFGDNKYWNAAIKTCVTCGSNTFKSGNECRCIDESSGKLLYDYATHTYSCKCDEDKNYFRKGNDCVRCINTSTETKYWDPTADNNFGQCRVCGYGAEYDIDLKRCRCVNDTMISKIVNGNEFVCQCDASRGLYYNPNTQMCEPCPTSDYQRWITYDAISGKGMCKKCNQNTQKLNPEGECECDITRHYYNNAYPGAPINCVKCDTVNTESYWDATNRVCVSCEGNTENVMKTGQASQCVCDNNKGFFGSATSANALSDCGSCGLPNDRNSVFVKNASGNQGVCLRCDTSKEVFDSSTNTCKCDNSRNYYGEGAKTIINPSGLVEIVQGNCTMCSGGGTVEKYWNDGYCITCGQGAEYNSQTGRCECKYIGTISSNITTSPKTITTVCKCNESQEFYGNDPSSCKPCNQANHVYKNGFCYKCDPYSTSKIAGNTANGVPCQCKTPQSTVIENQYNYDNITCICDESRSWYGTDPLNCKECKEDATFDRYWNGSVCKQCDKRTGAFYNGGNECACPSGKTLVNEDRCECDPQQSAYPSLGNNAVCEPCVPQLYNNTNFYKKNFVGNRCLVCGANQYISRDNVCVCDEANGYYPNPYDSTSCIQCKGNQSYWDNSTGSCMTCSTNSSKQNNTCVCNSPTMVKSIAYGGFITCEVCPKGTFARSDKDGCVPCPAGSTTNAPGAIDSMQCSASTTCTYPNYFNDSGKCTECPVNSLTDPTYNNHLGLKTLSACACKPGYYGNNGACTMCPAGTYSSNLGATQQSDCKKAPAGTVPTRDHSGYTPCPINTYAANTGNSVCTPCENNKITINEGSINSDACVCRGGMQTDASGACLTCPYGFTSALGGSCMKICSSSNEYWYNNQCIACDPGYTVNAFHNGCIRCPQDTYRSASDENCRPCPAGTNSANGASSIDKCFANQCPAGSYKDVTGACLECPDGKTSPLGSRGVSSCVPAACPPGQIVIGNVCDYCPIGMEPDTNDLTRCVTCQPNYVKGVRTNISCSPCPAGTVSSSDFVTCEAKCETNPLSYYDAKTGQCAIAPIGTVPDLSRTSYKKCPIGTYRSVFHPIHTTAMMTECAACPMNSTTLVEGASNINQCVCNDTEKIINVITNSCEFCPAGQETTNEPNTCQLCPKGSYRDNLSANGSCTECPSGTTTSTTGKTSFYDCDPGECLAGEYKTSTYEGRICTSCPASYPISNRGSLYEHQCRACGVGQEPDPNDMSRCKPCDHDHYKNTTSGSSCTRCPLDKPLSEGGGDITSCYTQTCPAGFFYQDATRTCAICPVGSTSTLGSTTCESCPSGKTTELSDPSRCVPCPENTYRDKDNDYSGVCISCASFSPPDSGQVYTSLAGSATCELASCPQGQEVKMVNGRNTCALCDVGTVSINGISCAPCGPGFGPFEPTSRGNSICAQCASGYFSSNGVCEICPEGSYSSSGASNCTSCPDNKTSAPGSTNETDCVYCPQGTTKVRNNATGFWNCAPCENNKSTSTSNSLTCDVNCALSSTSEYTQNNYTTRRTMCTTCSTGQVLDTNGTCHACHNIDGYNPDDLSQIQLDNTICDGTLSRTSCPGGKIPNASHSECVPCTGRAYKKDIITDPHKNTPRDEYECTPCGSNLVPNANRTQCDFCPGGHGFDSTAANSNYCSICQRGEMECGAKCQVQFTTKGNLQGLCIDCPAGRYMDEIGSSDSGCKSCLNNESVNRDQTGCIACPSGTSINNNYECVPCAPGFYRDTSQSDFGPQCKPCVGETNPTQTACLGCAPGKIHNVETHTCVPCSSLSKMFDYFGNTPTCISPPTGSVFKNDVFVKCPLGTYKPDDGNNSCTPCPNNKLTSDIGSSSLASCAYDHVYQTSNNGTFIPPGNKINGSGDGYVPIDDRLTSYTQRATTIASDAIDDMNENVKNLNLAAYYAEIRANVADLPRVIQDFSTKTDLKYFDSRMGEYNTIVSYALKFGNHDFYHYMIFKDSLPTLDLTTSKNIYSLKTAEGLLYKGDQYKMVITQKPKGGVPDLVSGSILNLNNINANIYIENKEYLDKQTSIYIEETSSNSSSHLNNPLGLYVEVKDVATGKIKGKILKTTKLNFTEDNIEVLPGYQFGINKRNDVYLYNQNNFDNVNKDAWIQYRKNPNMDEDNTSLTIGITPLQYIQRISKNQHAWIGNYDKVDDSKEFRSFFNPKNPIKAIYVSPSIKDPYQDNYTIYLDSKLYDTSNNKDLLGNAVLFKHHINPNTPATDTSFGNIFKTHNNTIQPINNSLSPRYMSFDFPTKRYGYHLAELASNLRICMVLNLNSKINNRVTCGFKDFNINSNKDAFMGLAWQIKDDRIYVFVTEKKEHFAINDSVKNYMHYFDALLPHDINQSESKIEIGFKSSGDLNNENNILVNIHCNNQLLLKATRKKNITPSVYENGLPLFGAPKMVVQVDMSENVAIKEFSVGKYLEDGLLLPRDTAEVVGPYTYKTNKTYEPEPIEYLE